MRIAIIGLLAGLMLAAVGCGSITMGLDTEVGDDADAVHSLVLSATGDMADLIGQGFEEESSGALSDKCQADYSIGQFDIKCSELTTAELNLDSQDSAPFNLEVVKSESPSYTEYRASMPNPFWETQRELDDNPLAADGMDAIIRLRFRWNVNMPGEIVESETNADLTNDGEAEFNISLDETRDTLVVVSRKSVEVGVPAIVWNCLGWAPNECRSGSRVVVKYWSVLALAIVVVLTALAILRSDWKDRSTVMVAVMVLGCLAIFSHVAFSFTYHDGYAATMQVLTILALISIPGRLRLRYRYAPNANHNYPGCRHTYRA